MAGTPNGDHLVEARDALRAELERWSTLQQELALRMVLVLVPDNHQVIPSLRERQAELYSLDVDQLDSQRPNKLVAAPAKELKITLIDPTPAFFLPAAPNEELYDVHDNHLRLPGMHSSPRRSGSKSTPSAPPWGWWTD